MTESSNLDIIECSPAFEEYLEDIFKTLVDPISLELMLDPVLTVDNMTYERETIEQWFSYCDQHGREYTSPVTNETLSSKDLRPNIAMKSILAATIKYLESKEKDGSLEGKARNMLSRYKEYEAEKLQKIAQEQAMEERFCSLNVTCQRHHKMLFMRQNRVPRQYTSRFRQVNITCDLCHTQMIHRTPHPFYFNCGTCNFDVCDECIAKDDVQDQINSAQSLDNTNRFAGIDDMDDLQRLEELLRLVMQAPRVTAGTGANNQVPALGATLPTTYVPQEERPSRMSRFMNMLRNPFRSTEQEQEERNPIFMCPRGHHLTTLLGELPPRYESASCDTCFLTHLENSDHEFYHCSRCRFDMCHNCMQARMESMR